MTRLPASQNEGDRRKMPHSRRKRLPRLLSQNQIPHQRMTLPLLNKQPAKKRPKRLNRQRTCRLSSRQGHGPKRRRKNSEPILAKRRRRLRAANRTGKQPSAEV